MTREKREALSQRIWNFYYNSANKSVKTRVNYFKSKVFHKVRYIMY